MITREGFIAALAELLEKFNARIEFGEIVVEDKDGDAIRLQPDLQGELPFVCSVAKLSQ